MVFILVLAEPGINSMLNITVLQKQSYNTEYKTTIFCKISKSLLEQHNSFFIMKVSYQRLNVFNKTLQFVLLPNRDEKSAIH